MSLNEIIILCLTTYSLFGTLCMFGAALADSRPKGMAFAFFCWPVIAWYGLLVLIERARN